MLAKRSQAIDRGAYSIGLFLRLELRFWHMEFWGCTDYLIDILLLDEHSCQDKIFVMVFVGFFFKCFLYS